MTSIGIAIITHCAKHHLPLCLPPLINSSLNPRIVVVNSSSKDGTVELAQNMGVETLVIPRIDFNHGTTRELARKYLDTDIVVMMTPDAYFLDSQGLALLVKPIVNQQASVAYARQISHTNSNFFESFPRNFNYPPNSHIRGLTDKSRYGVYTFFCSNSCAAYFNDALDEIGGFSPVLLGEDTLAVIKLLENGHRIAYSAEAIVRHSHAYSLKQEFERHFDTGLARVAIRTHLELAGKDTDRGKKYLREMFSQILQQNPILIPYACLHILSKWLGFKIGTLCLRAPIWLKKKFSSQDFYWSSSEFQNQIN